MSVAIINAAQSLPGPAVGGRGARFGDVVMLGLVLACPHALAAYRPADRWPDIHRLLAGDVPQPTAFADETPDNVIEHAARADSAFGALADSLRDYAPDAIVIVSDDGGAIFGPTQVPQFTVYTGRDINAPNGSAFLGEPESGLTTVECDQELAEEILAELVDHELDMTYSQFLNPQASDGPRAEGPRTVIWPLKRLDPGGIHPVVPLFVNTRVTPAPDGNRCYTLGNTLAEILSSRKERVALVVAGGMSGDPLGPRAGHIDVRLDRWAMEQIRRGRGERLKPMFDLDSDTLRGSTAEYRQWIVGVGAGEAMGAAATVVDYIPAHHATVGLGFVAWQAN